LMEGVEGGFILGGFIPPFSPPAAP
jgi:hypothetical protein